ncbi:MAG TPA: hypothetical protein VM141_04115 [Planctomycetota bacterium]|nr:hypothetical protein [Planctomycetota bacterium]
MSRGKAIILGIFTAWPFLYVVFFMCTVFLMMTSGLSCGGRSSGAPAFMWIVFPLHFFTMILIPVLLVIYILHVFKTNRIPQDRKALWAVVLFLGNMIAMPIYWYLYIWKEPAQSPPTSRAEGDPANK